MQFPLVLPLIVTAIFGSRVHGGDPLKSTRVAGGHFSQKGEVPYIVAITQDGRKPPLVCGGSIYDKSYILTAAHCFNYVSGVPLWVTAGALNFTGLDGTEQRVRVEMYAQHPEFDRATHRNDIAIIKLATELVFNDYVKPTELPPAGLSTSGGPVARLVTLSGWGSTLIRKMDDPRTPHSDALKTVPLEIYAREECNAMYDNTTSKDIRNKPLGSPSSRVGIKHGSDTVFCAGLPPLTEAGFCGGDDGGPLECMRRGPDGVTIKYLCGIASTAAGCGLPLPDLYTDVAQFTTWIQTFLKTKWIYSDGRPDPCVPNKVKG